MTTDDQLAEVFDRGLADGVDTLSFADRELFRIQDFIIEFEMNGLSGYFYNRLPDLCEIAATVEAMRKHSPALAGLLYDAAQLFNEYTDPDPPTTWSNVLKRHDPTDRLCDVHDRIAALDSYGLSGQSNAEPSGESEPPITRNRNP